MAVILQPVVGARRGDYHYPDFSGVARSYNYYPFGAARPDDGVATVALGLGKTVVDGDPALRFCPALPQAAPPQFADQAALVAQSQRAFYAVDLRTPANSLSFAADRALVRLDLDEAERHGALNLLGSVWCRENGALYDGIHRPGARVVSFAHILKNDAFPLAALLRRLLLLGRNGLNSPVEIEFAANLASTPRELAVLQIRPCCVYAETENIEVTGLPETDLLCYSPQALGHGVLTGIADVVYVKPETFDPAHTPQIATDIGRLNEQLVSANRPCVLIGPGRWGSSHSRLGIPVNWAQICAARMLVETTLQDFFVEPSQGSHFFQNLTGFGVAYLAVNPFAGAGGFVDWDWLAAQPAEGETVFVRHVRLAEPLEGRVDGRASRGAILKRARYSLT